MAIKNLIKTALITTLIIPSVLAEVRLGRKFELILGASEDVSVERKETQCVHNRRGSRYTQKQWDEKERTTCSYLEIKNAYIVFNDNGEQHGPINIKTNTIINEKLTAVVSDHFPKADCVQGITDALKRQLTGKGLGTYPANHPSAGKKFEKLNIPQFQGTSFDDDGNLVVDTAQGNTVGLLNQTFSYRKTAKTTGGDIPNHTITEGCNPSMFSQLDRVKIVDDVYTKVEDADAPAGEHIVNGARNTGIFLRRGAEGISSGLTRLFGSNSQSE